MKKWNVVVLLLAVCLLWPVTVNGQALPKDSTTTNRMSYERADSLLISASKRNYYHSDALVTVNDTIAIEIELQEEEVVLTEESNNENVEIIRKRATVNRSDLLIDQGEGKNLIKEEDRIVDYRDLRSINEGTLVGIGGVMMKDTYLSPEKYAGVGLRFKNERMRLTKLADSKISNQNMVNVEFASVMNGARNANFLATFADYSYGLHYRFIPKPNFKLLYGGSVRGMLGMVYNTRNGNNPLTVHTDIDLNISFLVIYEFRIKKSHLAIRYQFDSPVFGVLFSPVFEQSYYEIFSLGNTAEIYNINSFHNKLAMRNYLTLDFPLGNITVRAGYYGNFYSTSINTIDRYIISHNFMIGFAKEFVAFGGRDLRKRNLFNSAYY